ncbi:MULTISPECIES: hypothetical protein [unclassified Chelatococcus]|uniref:hypothetical protein n=1 Tax=unclassified Chelatococcus TaxID=2638111 RepID=UPI001BCBB1E4|nr:MULTISPECIES: hypothetical protein [unclassified Chelatococcus]MBS7698441.1 hypothetical protein [Chelatococcus sp. YT9]MBX3559481.1 hypothetical protein [Chelatococcus sp.]
MSLLWRCAICIAAIYWFSPVHDRAEEQHHATPPAAAQSRSAITGSVGKTGPGTTRPLSPADNARDLITAAEQATRLLNSLDAETRRHLIDALIATPAGGATGARQK